MKIVAGLNLTSIKPKVWDAASPYHLPKLGAVMVSYAEFHQSQLAVSALWRMGYMPVSVFQSV